MSSDEAMSSNTPRLQGLRRARDPSSDSACDERAAQRRRIDLDTIRHTGLAFLHIHSRESLPALSTGSQTPSLGSPSGSTMYASPAEVSTVRSTSPWAFLSRSPVEPVAVDTNVDFSCVTRSAAIALGGYGGLFDLVRRRAKTWPLNPRRLRSMSTVLHCSSYRAPKSGEL